MTRKTLIHHDGALGDLLLSLPTIKAIRDRSGEVYLAGRPDAAGLLRDSGYVDEAIDAGSSLLSCLYADGADERAKAFLSRFQSGFVFTRRGGSVLARNMQQPIPRTRIILTIPPEGSRIHVAEFRMRQLDSEGVGISSGGCGFLPRLEIPPSRKNEAKAFLRRSGYGFRRPLVAIHPGSGGRRKCWPFERYVRLTEMMAAACDPVFVLFSGPAEDDRAKAEIQTLADTRGKSIVHVCDEDLSVVAAILSLCALYVGNDSGISHLASLVNGRVVSVFGPTDPLLWRPLGDSVRVVSAGPECSPCSDHRSKQCASRQCLERVTVNEVYAACEEALGRRLLRRRRLKEQDAERRKGE